MQGRYLTAYAPSMLEDGGILHPRFVLGFVLFLAGMAINWQADSILRNLRKPGETGYKIPRVSGFDIKLYNNNKGVGWGVG